jgi:hypothetical protein
MSDIWAPVIAALGSSLLTGLIAFGLEWWRSKAAEKSALTERRSRAYSQLLTRSIVIMQLASDLHTMMAVRSGLREGVNTLFGVRKAIDPMDLASLMRAEAQPLFEAWSEVWVVGSKEAIAAANDLIAQGGDVFGAATQPGQALPSWLKGITGEKWTQEQLDHWQDEVRNLAEARRKFGAIARKEIGVEIADLFASNGANKASPLASPQEHAAN